MNKYDVVLLFVELQTIQNATQTKNKTDSISQSSISRWLVEKQNSYFVKQISVICCAHGHMRLRFCFSVQYQNLFFFRITKRLISTRDKKITANSLANANVEQFRRQFLRWCLFLCVFWIEHFTIYQRYRTLECFCAIDRQNRQQSIVVGWNELCFTYVIAATNGYAPRFVLPKTQITVWRQSGRSLEAQVELNICSYT